MGTSRYLSRREQIATLLVLVFVEFLHMLDFAVVMPLGPQLMLSFGISPQEFSLLVAGYSAGAVFAGVVGALCVDRFDRKRVMVLLVIGLTGATYVCGTATSFPQLLASRVAAGMFGGALEAIGLAIVADGFPEDRRASATGQVMAGIALAMVLGVPLGLGLAAWQDWRSPFLLIAAFGCVAVVAGLSLLPAMRSHLSGQRGESAWQGLTGMLRLSVHRRALLCTVVLMLAVFSIPPYLATYYVFNLHVRHEDLPIVYFVGGTFAVLSGPLTGWLADRHGKGRIAVAAAVLAMAAMTTITNLPSVPLVVVVVCAAFLMASVMGLYTTAVAIIVSTVDPSYRGRYLSLNTTCEQIGMTLATFLAGSIVGTDADGHLTGFGIVGFVAAVGAGLAVILLRRLCVDGGAIVAMPRRVRRAK